MEPTRCSRRSGSISSAPGLIVGADVMLPEGPAVHGRMPGLLRQPDRELEFTRAMEEAAGNKSRAAELVGLASYQTLTNWLSKYGVSR